MESKRKTIIREIRGIPRFLLVEYLEEMGGSSKGEDLVETARWRARLERMEPFRLGSLSVGQTRITIEIEEAAEEEFIEVFSKKTLRAGG
jgi:hypothetical protein